MELWHGGYRNNALQGGLGCGSWRLTGTICVLKGFSTKTPLPKPSSKTVRFPLLLHLQESARPHKWPTLLEAAEEEVACGCNH